MTSCSNKGANLSFVFYNFILAKMYPVCSAFHWLHYGTTLKIYTQAENKVLWWIYHKFMSQLNLYNLLLCLNLIFSIFLRIYQSIKSNLSAGEDYLNIIWRICQPCFYNLHVWNLLGRDLKSQNPDPQGAKGSWEWFCGLPRQKWAITDIRLSAGLCKNSQSQLGKYKTRAIEMC